MKRDASPGEDIEQAASHYVPFSSRLFVGITADVSVRTDLSFLRHRLDSLCEHLFLQAWTT